MLEFLQTPKHWHAPSTVMTPRLWQRSGHDMIPALAVSCCTKIGKDMLEFIQRRPKHHDAPTTLITLTWGCSNSGDITCFEQCFVSYYPASGVTTTPSAGTCACACCHGIWALTHTHTHSHSPACISYHIISQSLITYIHTVQGSPT